MPLDADGATVMTTALEVRHDDCQVPPLPGLDRMGARATHARPGAGEARPRDRDTSRVQGRHLGRLDSRDLLVAATASCYTVTLIAVAEQKGLALHDLRVGGTGHLERRADRRFGFTVIDLVATLTVDHAQRERGERVARYAKGVCIVGGALDVPVHLEIHVVTQAEANVA
jgi:organic hydroperoxide reductase OsmC/OhrA